MKQIACWIGALVVVLGVGCEPDKSNPNVGLTCMPSEVPEGGFDQTESSVELEVDACGGDVCLVHKLQGDPTRACSDASDDGCLSPSVIADHVYCSCRCKGAAEGEDNCECPDNYDCVPTFEHEGDDLNGSYCVRKGTY